MNIESLRPHVAEEFFVNQILSNAHIITHLDQTWLDAEAQVRSAFANQTTSRLDLPKSMEQTTFSGFNCDKVSVIGVAGPGAVGKNTLINHLSFRRVINSTTRARRSNEIDGKDYHFLSDSDFHHISTQNGFLITTFREGRGWYGISREAVNVIEDGPCIIEESPLNLLGVSQQLRFGHSGAEKKMILIYLLPPAPMFETLLLRLCRRCANDSTDLASTLESTLGPRQITELLSVQTCIRELPVLFLVNDSVQRITDLVRRLI